MPVKTKPLPSIEVLEKLFNLDETSPTGLRWKTTRGSRALEGSIAGTKHNEGYWQVGITLDGKKSIYLCHRIVFYMKTREKLDDKYIDHVNGCRSDTNDIRICTFQQNLSNRLKANCINAKKPTSRYKGVSWDKFTKKWKAQIRCNGRNINLGRFEIEVQAAEVYNQAALNQWGEFAKLNDIVT